MRAKERADILAGKCDLWNGSCSGRGGGSSRVVVVAVEVGGRRSGGGEKERRWRR